MRCGGRSAKPERNGLVPVFLNVYDLTSMNGFSYWLGLGAYHSAVQVHGVEYAFGSHEHPTTGIFEGEPRQCQGFTFRKQILIGSTEKTWMEVRKVMEELAEDYKGTSYNLITRNCNHFCNDVCVRLTGNTIPSWINRLARIGLLCNCIIPASVNSINVGSKVHNDGEISKNQRSRSVSERYAASSSSSSLSSDKTSLPLHSVARTRSHRSKASLPPSPSPSSPLILKFCFSFPASP